MAIELRTYMPYYYDIKSNTVVLGEESPDFAVLNTLYVSENLPAGTYCITMGFSWSMPDVNDSALFVMRSTPTVSDEIIQSSEPKDQSDRVIRTISMPIEYAGGPITITLEASSTPSSADLTIYHSSLQLERKQ